ncbi:MAG: LysM peptidoglycan-binding domain-containing protein [Betaproteobacteria bacterium]|nr:MAG: LysM peptidoglycan-binding domain-containing protein [Betaproteobacteria bacterium]
MLANRSRVVAASLALAVGGCMTAKQPAPVVQRSPEAVRPGAVKPGPRGASADARPETYTVKRGDTLYSIALDHGQDYRDLVRWNNLTNPNVIEVGQVLRVRAPAAAAVVSSELDASGTAVTAPYQAAPMVEGRDIGTQPPGPPALDMPPSPLQPGLDKDVISTPKAVKLPYSDAALARLRTTPPDVAAAPGVVAPAESGPRAESAASADGADAVAWAWPTTGKVVANFNENGGPKGLQIAGELGQAIRASAGGRVVYTGSGLRGYGNLVIIKHNNTYLSAYAHNRTVLVKQGDSVAKGQKIAEMGSSDASRVMLHFEIRRLGKPVDPMKFLPPA